MTRMFRWVVVAAVMTMVLPGMAAAENFYAAIRGGPGWTTDKESGLQGQEDIIEFKTGFSGSGAVGYAFPFGLRAEGEFGFLYSPVKRDGDIDLDGSIKSYLLMANVYYDLKLAALGPFKPYVGFGLGGARVHHDHEYFNDRLSSKARADDWRTAFAYQARAGVGYELNKWLDVSLGYRYVHIDGEEQQAGGRTITIDKIGNHSIELGFAFKF